MMATAARVSMESPSPSGPLPQGERGRKKEPGVASWIANPALLSSILSPLAPCGRGVRDEGFSHGRGKKGTAMLRILSRRELLTVGSIGLAGLSLPGFFRARAERP